MWSLQGVATARCRKLLRQSYMATREAVKSVGGWHYTHQPPHHLRHTAKVELHIDVVYNM
jgi:hypothetical protein